MRAQIIPIDSFKTRKNCKAVPAEPQILVVEPELAAARVTSWRWLCLLPVEWQEAKFRYRPRERSRFPLSQE